MIKNSKKTKTSELKIRITEQDKELFKQAAKKQNLSVSSYIRDTCRSECTTYLTALELETNNVFNEIYHYFIKQGNTQSAESVKTLYGEYMQRRNKS